MVATKSGRPRVHMGFPGARGKMPTKRSINLVLIDENKITLKKALPGILAILVLAALFSKFLVYDRLMEVSAAQARVTQLQTTLDDAMALVDTFGDVENTYAHYTLSGMTAAELGLVDRVAVLDLIDSTLPIAHAQLASGYFSSRLSSADVAVQSMRTSPPTFKEMAGTLKQRFAEFLGIAQSGPTVASTWSISGNVLTLDVVGNSLETLNAVAQELQQSPLVDTCTVSTANKSDRRELWNRVSGRLIVYLKQPAEEVTAP